PEGWPFRTARRHYADALADRLIGPGVGRTLTLGGGVESSLEGSDIELSVSPKDIRTSPYDLCANRSDRRQSREGDRWFESTSLQRGVRRGRANRLVVVIPDRPREAAVDRAVQMAARRAPSTGHSALRALTAEIPSRA